MIAHCQSSDPVLDEIHRRQLDLGVGPLSVCLQFEKQVSLFPGRTAVNLGGTALTYLELNGLADALAWRMRESGVGAGALVGILLERSLELIISLIATLKVGAAYVPLDCHYPADRLLWMASDSRIQTLLTSGDLLAQVPKALGHVMLVNLAELKQMGAPSSVARLSPSCDGEELAYLMYTSGSTGLPKGVAIPHRGIVRLVCQPDFVDIEPADVFLHHSPASFDASTFEIWGALLNGSRLALLPPGPFSLAAVAETILREKITVLWLTAGLFNLLVDERLQDLEPLRQLLVGGEVLSVPHIERALAGLPGTQLINGYGPTENTTFTCCYRIPRGTTFPRGIPIGQPIRGTSVQVTDEALRPVPKGEVGELLTGGLGLALGYWRRPELTREQFVDDTVTPCHGAKLYRTGDLVRQRSDGDYEFVGRRDTQVKIRGFRVELGEIEAMLRTNPGVRDCAVGVSEGKQLVGYVVRHAEKNPSASDLREFLAVRLPGYLVPAAWRFLAALPLNPNGKIDRAALPGVSPAVEPAVGELPNTSLEGLIASLWREILGRDTFGVADNFFDMGADSLQVTLLHERLERRTGLALPVTDLFRFPTIRSLARHIEEASQTPVRAANPAGADRGRLQRSSLEHFRRV